MEIGILLLVVLFIVGFINTLFYVPPNKFLAYMLSFFPYNTSSSCSNMSTKSSTSPIFSPPEEEEENKNKKKNKSTHELKKVFATFDKNGDGFITKQELKDSLKSIGLFCNDKEVGTMVEMLDANGDGLIDIDEFYDMYESMVKPSGGGEGDGVEKEEEEGELREAFDVFDGDKDGLISVEELDSVLSSLGLKQGMRLEDCKEMINKVDIDGDGMVNFDEFKQMMRGGGNLISVS